MSCVLGVCLAVAGSVPGTAQVQQQPAPIERRPPSTHAPSSFGSFQAVAPERPGPRGEHLAQWMNQHSSLTPGQQQQALEHEPGFETLPKNTQQRMLNRLAQLDAMNPHQRDRVLARTEAMEKLNPEQRSEVRSAMSQLGNLPQPDRRAVAQTFRALRALPPEQRIQAYSSGRYGAPLNGAQQSVLFDLLRVEPLMGSMLPPAGMRPPGAPIPSMGLR